MSYKNLKMILVEKAVGVCLRKDVFSIIRSI